MAAHVPVVNQNDNFSVGQLMNPIALLTNGINDLWFWTYSLVAGWGVTVTLLIASIIFLAVKVLRMDQKVSKLEERLIHAERDYNITISKWQK